MKNNMQYVYTRLSFGNHLIFSRPIHAYAFIQVTTEPVDHEAEPFWMPSSDYEEIYQQMSAKKYLEIPRQQIQ